MSNVKALIVGVSNYLIDSAKDLPFCKNDIVAMKSALCNGLKMNENDIIICGKSGYATRKEFIKALDHIEKLIKNNDIFIFYFSGHGALLCGAHYLVFSDGIINTQEIIKYFEKIICKSKIIFLDCCYSGNYHISKKVEMCIEDAVEDFFGRGCAVFASSKSSEFSYRHPNESISLFTSFLCEALQSKFLIKEGKISLYDIQNLVFLYSEIWNKQNPTMQQHPIFRANMGGTILFDVEDYKPYISKKVYYENDKYIIYDVNPMHTGTLKKYSIKVILKQPFSLREIAEISLEIKDMAKRFEVFNRRESEISHKGKLANIIWIYFGRDESDIINNNYLCHTTWVDDKQNKEWWYRTSSKDTFIENGVHFTIHSYYKYLKKFTLENIGNKEELILKMKNIMFKMVNLAEQIIHLYNEYKNDVITELDLVEYMEDIIPEIDKLYLESTDLEIAPIEIKEWSQACSELFCTIHNFIYYYNKNYLDLRTAENRKNCMEMTIKQYYKDLDKVKRMEKSIK